MGSRWVSISKTFCRLLLPFRTATPGIENKLSIPCQLTSAATRHRSPMCCRLLPPTAAATRCCLLAPPPDASSSPPHSLPFCVFQVITPWDVTGGADGKIDYNKLVAQVRAACRPLSFCQEAMWSGGVGGSSDGGGCGCGGAWRSERG